MPSLGAVSPEPMLSKVDLPQPLGPISDTTSPSRDRDADALHGGEVARPLARNAS